MNEIPKTCGQCQKAAHNPFFTRLSTCPTLGMVDRCQAPPADCPLRQAETLEQPDTVPVPPKAERDGVWIERAEYGRMRAFAEFGAYLFWSAFDDFNHKEIDFDEVFEMAVVAGLITESKPDGKCDGCNCDVDGDWDDEGTPPEGWKCFGWAYGKRPDEEFYQPSECAETKGGKRDGMDD